MQPLTAKPIDLDAVELIHEQPRARIQSDSYRTGGSVGVMRSYRDATRIIQSLLTHTVASPCIATLDEITCRVAPIVGVGEAQLESLAYRLIPETARVLLVIA